MCSPEVRPPKQRFFMFICEYDESHEKSRNYLMSICPFLLSAKTHNSITGGGVQRRIVTQAIPCAPMLDTCLSLKESFKHNTQSCDRTQEKELDASSWGWGQVYKYLCSRHQWCVTLHLAKNPSACTPWDAGGCLSMQWTHIITPRPTNLTAGGAASMTSFLSGWSFLASFSSPSEDRAHILDYYLNPYLIWHTSAYFASFPWIK